MNESDIVKSLHRHCAKHICFGGVKNGPSRVGFRQIDFLAIEKTWSPTCFRAYEIKTSRADFLNDKKWPEYMALCNKFYWACPKGLIKKDEVDPKVGLVYVNPKGGNCHVMKGAVYRPVALDAPMLLYLIFWRMGVGNEGHKYRMMEIEEEMEKKADLGRRYKTYASKELSAMAEKLRKMEEIKRDDRVDAVLEWLTKNNIPAYRLVEVLNTAERVRGLAWTGKELRSVCARVLKLADELEGVSDV